MKPYKHVHFVGIGGVGMSALARVLLSMGIRVSGSDLNMTPTLDTLRAVGGAVSLGHARENIRGADAVVISSAIPLDNPEVVAARRAFLPVLQRAELLGEIMADKRGIAVSGTHGKTTTTAMIAAVLECAGISPTVVVGGDIEGSGSGARLGSGDIVVAEADESDASFLRLSPWCAVITNIENDHLGYYRDLDHLVQTFSVFAQRVGSEGVIVATADCPAVVELLRRARRSPSLLGEPKVISVGFDTAADVRAETVHLANFGSSFTVQRDGRKLGDVALRVPGLINISNALCAVAVGAECGVPFASIAKGLAQFGGVARRFEILYAAEIVVADDYAHHPTAVQETIAAARAYWPGRIIVAFQPHRYSRTAYLFRDFARALMGADEVVVLDIYSAGEPPLPGVRAESIIDALSEADGAKPIVHQATLAQALAHLENIVRAGDLVLTLGAGDIGWIAHALAAALKRRRHTSAARSGASA